MRAVANADVAAAGGPRARNTMAGGSRSAKLKPHTSRHRAGLEQVTGVQGRMATAPARKSQARHRALSTGSCGVAGPLSRAEVASPAGGCASRSLMAWRQWPWRQVRGGAEPVVGRSGAAVPVAACGAWPQQPP